MKFGDILRKNLYKFKKAAKESFQKTLIEIASEEIKNSKDKVSSDFAIPCYYKILKENENKIPNYFKSEKSGQKRYRIINRNIWSSNAYRHNGLAKREHEGIKAIKNEETGCITYSYVN